jgi:hypothetical protein
LTLSELLDDVDGIVREALVLEVGGKRESGILMILLRRKKYVSSFIWTGTAREGK